MLLITLTVESKDPIDTKNYQQYLLATSILHQNNTRKFIVDVLWNGINELLKLNDNEIDECLTSLNYYKQGVTKNVEQWALKSK